MPFLCFALLLVVSPLPFVSNLRQASAAPLISRRFHGAALLLLRWSRLRCTALFLRKASHRYSNAHLSGASLCHCFSWLCDAMAWHVCAIPPPHVSKPFLRSSLRSMQFRSSSNLRISTAPRRPSYLRISGAYHVSSGSFRFLAIRSNAFSAQLTTHLFLYKSNRIYTIPLQCLSSLCLRWSCRGHSFC